MEIDNRIWVIGTVIVIVAVAAMGWFLGISPVLDTVNSNDAQRQTVETQNLAQERNLAAIKKEFQNIDKLKSQLADLRIVIPDSDDLSTFIGQLHQLEASSSVVLNSISTGDGRVFAAPETQGNATTAEGASDSAEDPSIAAVSKGNFVVVPIELRVTGAHAQVMDFIDALQKGPRLFLVTDLTVAEDTAGGDVYSGSISGYVYVLLDNGGAPGADASTTPADSGK